MKRLVRGSKLLHTGGDGRSNGVGIIVSEKIKKYVIRVTDTYAMVGNTEANGVCYVDIWATNGKD